MHEVPQTPKDQQDMPPNWDSVLNRIKMIGVPENIHDRADDVAAHLTTGEDIEMFGKALHDVLAPGVRSMPVDRRMNTYNRETGEHVHSFAEPEERSEIFLHAADYIGKLATMRRSPDDDDAFLARVANVVALSFGYAHSYENGNGRLARFTAELIRNGTRDWDDLMLLGTSREYTMKTTGRKIPSFVQRYESVDAGETYTEVLAAAASLDIPFDERHVYERRASDTFSTTSGF